MALYMNGRGKTHCQQHRQAAATPQAILDNPNFGGPNAFVYRVRDSPTNFPSQSNTVEADRKTSRGGADSRHTERLHTACGTRVFPAPGLFQRRASAWPDLGALHSPP